MATEVKTRKIKKININAGHNAAGKTACGAVGFLNESKENRRVAKHVIKLLKEEGVKVYNCTVDNAPSQRENLIQIAKLCNAHDVDLNVFIHFNSGAHDQSGNGTTTGTECLVVKKSGIRNDAAKAICKNIAKLGYKNRGVKVSTNLYVLNNTKAPAVLVECCFVDDKDDYKLYGYKKMAKAIVKGLMSLEIEE